MIDEGLYGAFEVGYRKDVIHWADTASLLDGLHGKIRAIQQHEQRLIGDSRRATDYFTAAAKRGERALPELRGQGFRDSTRVQACGIWARNSKKCSIIDSNPRIPHCK